MTKPAEGQPAGRLSVADRIDDACDQFEAAWKRGRPLRIEDCLAAWGGPAPALLVRELLLLEIEYRQRRGDALMPQEYLDRFAVHEPIVREVFDRGATLVAAAGGFTPASGAQDPEPSDVALAAEPADPLAHSWIRDYRIIERIGGGGMGMVYKAVHQRLDKTVAIKILLPQMTHDSNAVSRFEREMQAVGKLDHPNIVRATDAGEFDGRHYLVMEYIEGRTLSDISNRSGPLAIAAACELARQSAIALEHVRQAGLVHRDIKPSNLMLTHGGQVKLLDLGLARLHRLTGGEELTSSGQIMGTFDYMAPEQVDNSHEVDIRADIYSLGCTLYKLLCGQAPFGGSPYSTPAKKLRAVLESPVPPIGQLRPEISPALAMIVSRAVAKRAEDRFQIPAELAAALAPWAKDCDVAALIGSASQTTPWRPGEMASGSTLEHFSSAATDTQPKIEPETKRWLKPLTNYPLTWTVVIALLPNVLLSVFNVAYDWSVIVSPLKPKTQHIFIQMLILMKSMLYLVGTVIGVGWSLPTFLAVRGIVVSDGQDTAVRRCLQLGDMVFWITAGAWTLSGVFFPTWLHYWAGGLLPQHYFHFFAAHVLCGLIAGTLAFFLITWLSVRVLAPTLVAAKGTQQAMLPWLTSLRGRIEWYSKLTFAVPFAAALSLGFSGIEYRLVFVELALLGAVVLVIGSRVNRSIQSELNTLSRAAGAAR